MWGKPCQGTMYAGSTRPKSRDSPRNAWIQLVPHDSRRHETLGKPPSDSQRSSHPYQNLPMPQTIAEKSNPECDTHESLELEWDDRSSCSSMFCANAFDRHDNAILPHLKSWSLVLLSIEARSRFSTETAKSKWSGLGIGHEKSNSYELHITKNAKNPNLYRGAVKNRKDFNWPCATIQHVPDSLFVVSGGKAHIGWQGIVLFITKRSFCRSV